ncbi:hypothetical protein XO10_00690 [Marinitoga sp. 1135]|uniref:type II toxin-antitoxin system RelE/ParE family toxin n=1 Tax=Marinitoga sp. 1135 TaxID=1643333 RepID=UPI001586A08A|nr:type II toxin-antitoxin system RelE/ParE family toxin [Marinitoga sp. 1135]NUU94834.1 hypothetical protein [Marinitoga sp. 1135]
MNERKLYFDKKVLKYLDKLASSTKTEDMELHAEIFKTFDLLMKFGSELKMPYSRPFRNYKYKGTVLKELRIRSHIQLRIFYFIKDNVIFVLFDYKIKKTQKFGPTILDPIFKKMKRIIDEMEG